MPWSNQSGGGGPWGRPGGNGGGGGPWGNGGKTPPNLEDLLKRGQDRLRNLIPGGGGTGGYGGGGSTGLGGGRSAAVIAALAVAVWLATGFYTVYPRQVGIETIFGRYVGTKGEGLRYNFPYTIGGVVKPDVGSQNSIQIGFRAGPNGQGRTRDVPDESLMLTGDENIVDLDFEVQWRVNPLKASDFVFNLQNPEGTIKAISESAMR